MEEHTSNNYVVTSNFKIAAASIKLNPQLGHMGHIALPDLLCIYMIVDIYRFLHGISPDPLHMVSAHPGPK